MFHIIFTLFTDSESKNVEINPTSGDVMLTVPFVNVTVDGDVSDSEPMVLNITITVSDVNKYFFTLSFSALVTLSAIFLFIKIGVYVKKLLKFET